MTLGRFTAIVVLGFLAGCTFGAKTRELEMVAKDWSLVIRASQVIPVYPLTEDLQPGDIFLVQIPIEQQVELYKSKGFLPLDQLVGRVRPSIYSSFYMESYGIGGRRNTPHHWQFPDGEGKEGWQSAPRAAFPSYTFSVKRGAGINLALPVQGVPVALSLLGTGSAEGSITIADAFTYGVDVESLNAQVEEWARAKRDFLRNFAPVGGKSRYVRIVTRVYLTGKVNISLFNDEASGAALSAGAAKPVDLMNPAVNNAAGNYDKALGMINQMIEKATPNLPGGALKAVAASSRSITLVETFPRPLVIGYLGFDRAILDGGRLGPPIPTQAVLTDTSFIASPRFVSNDQKVLQELIDRAKEKPESERAGLLKKAAENTSQEFQTLFNKRVQQGVPSLAAFLAAKNDYLKDERGEGARHDELIEALKAALK